MGNKTKEYGESILKNQMSSVACVAAAVLIDNGNLVAEGEKDLWWHLADAVETLMYRSDDPRFSLYDYLDAVLNQVAGDWRDTAKTIITSVDAEYDDGMDESLNILADLAETKRRTYSGEF